jgi:hypothetical protein
VEPAPTSKNLPVSSFSASSSPLSSTQSSRRSSLSSSLVSSYFPKLSSMIKLWPGTQSPMDQLTPKAGPHGQERTNPFEMAIPASPTAAGQTPQAFVHHLLSVPRSATADLTPQIQGAPLTPTSPGGNLALPTTHLTLHAPDFNMRQPPPSKRKSSTDKSSTPSSSSTSSGSSAGSAPTNGTASPSKGQIHVKLIQARGLNVRSVNARAYVVVQFEQNEFVSREPTDETDKEVKGTATTLSRNGSSNALSALSAIGSRAPPDSKRAKSSGDSSPSSSSRSSLAAPNNLFGRLSAHNPVWKHEVSLCVILDHLAQ